MRYLTSSGLNLVEVIDFPDADFEQFKKQIGRGVSSPNFLPVLDKCRNLSISKGRGINVIRYLLLKLNNRIIKSQLDKINQSHKLSGLYLKNGCIPFDDMPFNTSLFFHNPKVSDVFYCIQPDRRKHELLARKIQNNAEMRGHIYTPSDELTSYGDIDSLVTAFNGKVWHGHPGRKIQKFHNYFYIAEYKENTLLALRQLRQLASLGVKNYSNSVDSWLKSYTVDCEEKKTALREMFVSSSVALIYGPAGTGKSTIIKHASHYFSEFKKIYLTQTNPAIDNLRRKVDSSNCEFYTIAKFLKSPSLSGECAILIIDECSTVSNKDIKEVLDKAQFQLLILVGDIYQIEAIRFGNWFSAARSFIPKTSSFELTKPYRSQNKNLLELWKRVRNLEDTIIEHIARNDYSCSLDVTIFDHTDDEQIILCLNYDGLYGINNINRFLQDSNPGQAFEWGVHKYKIGDPILFNESNRFSPLIYNNMKGKISGIEILEGQNQIQFDVEIDMSISGMHASMYEFELLDNLENGNSVIRFTVNRYQTTDEDDDDSASNVVPFQVAYAVSIHKAQGLEYDSVKIVITDETDELITHNIFYTAITRARNNLKIYWSPEVEKKVIEQFKSKKPNKDVKLLELQDPSLAA
ncbi:MAG: ATP-dependent RecD-like DNA helicase [Verrucomicrobiota bacterium]